MQGDTIAAIATPPGAGAVGMVRLSGDRAFLVAERIFRPGGGKEVGKMEGYTGALGTVVDGARQVDEAIAFVYRSPRSYTGEDVVELSCHGGPWILQRVLRLCLANGARLAEAGEFTRRAFVNGKMNLSQAEAVMDMIGAQGDRALQAALAAREGVLSREVEVLEKELLDRAAHLAAWSDYPEEDLVEVDVGELKNGLRELLRRLDQLLSTYDQGQILREGVATVIVGRPNVGKSTLMNLLSGRERSIVTDLPGTTRDVVEDSVRLGDFVLHLSDTAGIRKAQDKVEAIGVDRAKELMERAQLILAVFDSSEELEAEDRELLELLEGKRCIAIINKIDLPRRLNDAPIRAAVPRTVTLSAGTGEGRRELEELVGQVLEMDKLEGGAPLLANERQRHCVQRARGSLDQAVSALEQGVTFDAVGVEMEDALDALLSLTGKGVSEQVVDAVFARFCVGK